MIHQPLGGAQGQAADIEIQAKEILFIRSLLNSYMAEYCDQPADKIQVGIKRVIMDLYVLTPTQDGLSQGIHVDTTALA